MSSRAAFSFRGPENIQPGSSVNDDIIKLGSGDGGGNDMLQRVKDLEKDVQQMKTDLAVIRSNYATREDLQKELRVQTWSIIGAIFTITALTLTAVKILF